MTEREVWEIGGEVLVCLNYVKKCSREMVSALGGRGQCFIFICERLVQISRLCYLGRPQGYAKLP